MNEPNCYKCIHRRTIPGDAHTRCVHPKIINPITSMADAYRALNIKGKRHGIENGWFIWPINFDPTWLITCSGFTEKDEKDV